MCERTGENYEPRSGLFPTPVGQDVLRNQYPKQAPQLTRWPHLLDARLLAWRLENPSGSQLGDAGEDPASQMSEFWVWMIRWAAAGWNSMPRRKGGPGRPETGRWESRLGGHDCLMGTSRTSHPRPPIVASTMQHGFGLI